MTTAASPKRRRSKKYVPEWTAFSDVWQTRGSSTSYRSAQKLNLPNLSVIVFDYNGSDFYATANSWMGNVIGCLDFELLVAKNMDDAKKEVLRLLSSRLAETLKAVKEVM